MKKPFAPENLTKLFNFTFGNTMGNTIVKDLQTGETHRLPVFCEFTTYSSLRNFIQDEFKLPVTSLEVNGVEISPQTSFNNPSSVTAIIGGAIRRTYRKEPVERVVCRRGSVA